RILKGGLEKHTAAEKRDYIRHSRPHGLSVAEGCRLMGLPRSTFYDAPSLKADDAEIIANMITICDEFETYGYRRVGAELRHRGILCAVSGSWPRPTATTTGPSSRTSPATGLWTVRTSSGWPTSRTSPSAPASSIWLPFSTPGRAGWSDMRLAARSTHVWQLQH